MGGEPAYSGQVTWCRFVICSRTPGHPDVGQSVNKLALVYKTQGRYPKAEPLYKRAFAIELGSRAVSHKARKPDGRASMDLLRLPAGAYGGCFLRIVDSENSNGRVSTKPGQLQFAT